MGQGKKGDKGKDGDSKRMRRKKAKKYDKKVELADINKASMDSKGSGSGSGSGGSIKNGPTYCFCCRLESHL